MDDSINSHEEVVPECDGCERKIKSIRNKIICSINKYPRINWWLGEKCPQATHIKRKPNEDPVKEP